MKSRKEIIVGNNEFILNTEMFCKIMQEHHLMKWNNYMRFIIQEPSKRLTLCEGDKNFKPIYLYKNREEVFYMSGDLVKTILSECFSNLDIENIELSYYIEKSNYIDLTRDIPYERGCPAIQEEIRMARHPECYKVWDCNVIFEGVKIRV